MKPKFSLALATMLAGLVAGPVSYAGNGNGNGNGSSTGTTSTGNGNSSNSSSSNSSSSVASSDPIIPVGTLVAAPNVVLEGDPATLDWSIMYPQTITDVVTISPPGQLTLLDQYYVDIQIVGSTVTTCDYGKAPTTNSYPTDARMSVNGGSYFQLFYGTTADVDSSKILYSKKLNKGTTLNFGGRYALNGAWSNFYTTKSGNMQVVALRNGDIPPTYLPLHQQATLANYLKPYLDSSGKIVIGPMSVLIVMELGQTDHSQSCFDLQDQVLLVTFRGKNNNGHGNNLDGVDSSNPGKGSGGPNGGVDPSGGVDDER